MESKTTKIQNFNSKLNLYKNCVFILVSIFLLDSCSMKPNDADTSWVKNKHLNLSYSNESESQKLDIYLPDKISNKIPVIIVIHGGAFMFGDKAEELIEPMLKGVKRGYAVISVNYRLSDESKFPSQIKDIKTTIRWIKANSKKYHLDSTKIALWGGSAGGYLAALGGTSGGDNDFNYSTSKMSNENYSDKVQAVIDWFGPINFSEMDKQFEKSKKGDANHGEEDSPESRVLGKKLSEIPELVQKSNPETYISVDDPYFFIQHGTEDENVPVEQSINFSKNLIKVLGKEKVTIELLKGAGHGGEEFESKENLDKVFDFLDKVLKDKN